MRGLRDGGDHRVIMGMSLAAVTAAELTDDDSAAEFAFGEVIRGLDVAVVALTSLCLTCAMTCRSCLRLAGRY